MFCNILNCRIAYNVLRFTLGDPKMKKKKLKAELSKTKKKLVKTKEKLKGLLPNVDKKIAPKAESAPKVAAVKVAAKTKPPTIAKAVVRAQPRKASR